MKIIVKTDNPRDPNQGSAGPMLSSAYLQERYQSLIVNTRGKSRGFWGKGANVEMSQSTVIPQGLLSTEAFPHLYAPAICSELRTE